MLILVGDTRSKEIVSFLQEKGWGRMMIDYSFQPYPGEPWGFDNGAYRDFKKGRSFDANRFLRNLEKAYRMKEKYHRPYLAVVPDIVAGGLRSLEFSLGWLDRLPKDFPWFLAVQDGILPEHVEDIIERFEGIFLGGTNRYKSTARIWAKFAHRHGKKFHYARAGTPWKYAHARRIGADSIDSAFPLWKKERLAYFLEGEILARQLTLF